MTRKLIKSAFDASLDFKKSCERAGTQVTLSYTTSKGQKREVVINRLDGKGEKMAEGKSGEAVDPETGEIIDWPAVQLRKAKLKKELDALLFEEKDLQLKLKFVKGRIKLIAFNLVWKDNDQPELFDELEDEENKENTDGKE